MTTALRHRSTRLVRAVLATTGHTRPRSEVPSSVQVTDFHQHAVPPTLSADAVDRELFRAAMAAFPAAVSVLTSYDAAGRPRGLTCSSVASLSADPPLVLACVNQSSGGLAAVRNHRSFGINLLHEHSADISARFASPSDDKFTGLTWRPAPLSGVPWLHQHTALFLDCRLVADVTIASHTILVGLVRDQKIDPHKPLMFLRRGYGTWAPLTTGGLAPPTPAAPAPQPLAPTTV